jgi:hypothetical protein
MFARTIGILATLGALLLPFGAPAPAHAAECPVPFWGIHCVDYLETGFGPVARATQISADGRARYGNFSPLTNQFLPATGWMRIYEEKSYHVWVGATDGAFGWFDSYTSVETAFGPASWGTQHQEIFIEGGRILLGRWGIYNLLTNTFYPDETGSSSWRLVTPQ